MKSNDDVEHEARKGREENLALRASRALRYRVWTWATVLLASTPLLAQDGQWLMYSGSYSSHRHSPLKQLTVENVAKLRPVWLYQPPGTGSVDAHSPPLRSGLRDRAASRTMSLRAMLRR